MAATIEDHAELLRRLRCSVAVGTEAARIERGALPTAIERQGRRPVENVTPSWPGPEAHPTDRSVSSLAIVGSAAGITGSGRWDDDGVGLAAADLRWVWVNGCSSVNLEWHSREPLDVDEYLEV